MILVRGVHDVRDSGAEMHFQLEDLVAVPDFDQVLAQPPLLRHGVLGVLEFLEVEVRLVRFKGSRRFVLVVVQGGHETCDDVSDHPVPVVWCKVGGRR